MSGNVVPPVARIGPVRAIRNRPKSQSPARTRPSKKNAIIAPPMATSLQDLRLIFTEYVVLIGVVVVVWGGWGTALSCGA